MGYGRRKVAGANQIRSVPVHLAAGSSISSPCLGQLSPRCVLLVLSLPLSHPLHFNRHP